jgi:hypothetical protein
MIREGIRVLSLRVDDTGVFGKYAGGTACR